MKLTATAIALAVPSVLLAACSGGGGQPAGSGGPGSAGGEQRYVENATFTMSLPNDPGNLDPQASPGSTLLTVTQFAYDNLLSVDPTGKIRSQLAKSWKVDGKTVTLTLAKGITCADGTPFTAADVVANVGYVADPKNKSPFLGTFLPAGVTAKATGTDTVTLTLAQPAPFVLNGLGSLPMVCQKGITDRKSLAGAANGTGPYQLTEVAPGDHYTYKRRDGYTWGPGGATTAEKGMPATVVLKVVENQSTAANLLLSGALNAADVQGADAERVSRAATPQIKTPAIAGEQWFNQNKGHPTSDPAVRVALTQALDLDQLRSVLTSGKGTPPTTLAAVPPLACPGSSVTGLPAHDAAAARSVLATLPELTFAYVSTGDSAGAAAAELAVKQWRAAGAKIKARAETATAIQQTVFGTGDWDIAWLTLNLTSPDQLVPFLSGPGAAAGGTNFSGIDNAEYEAGVKQAAAMNGAAGCATWLKAESSLFPKADVVPFANNVLTTFGKGATFGAPGQFVPTSIRMTA